MGKSKNLLDLYKFGAVFLALCFSTTRMHATELVYTPVNPSFGGNPLNGSVLLNAAQAQNKTKDPDAPEPFKITEKTALQQFNEMMERSVLSRLATAQMSSIMDEYGKLHAGTLVTANFTIDVADLGNGFLKVTTKDNFTGATTYFEVKK